jgi:hypothetical protein
MTQEEYEAAKAQIERQNQEIARMQSAISDIQLAHVPILVAIELYEQENPI